MIFYLIRHGRQNSSDCNVNVPLADAGIKQAELLGKRLRNYSIDAVYCSDLIRAKQTAEIRVLLCALFGGSFARRLQFGTSLENCSITAIHYDETLHGFFLDRFNDSAHLEGHPELFRGH